jgi:hypothetical protein
MYGLDLAISFRNNYAHMVNQRSMGTRQIQYAFGYLLWWHIDHGN